MNVTLNSSIIHLKYSKLSIPTDGNPQRGQQLHHLQVRHRQNHPPEAHQPQYQGAYRCRCRLLPLPGRVYLQIYKHTISNIRNILYLVSKPMET